MLTNTDSLTLSLSLYNNYHARQRHRAADDARPDRPTAAAAQEGGADFGRAVGNTNSTVRW